MIDLDDQQTLFPELAAALLPVCEKLVAFLKLEQVDISVVLCDDETIKNINSEWRGKNKATDVLSFPQFEEAYVDFDFPPPMPGGPPVFLGDIIISVETCERQAQEMGHSLLEEASRLWIHGFLHLCGYDHIDSEDAANMKEKEEFLLQEISLSISPLTTNHFL